jgi:hypothetical protein
VAKPRELPLRVEVTLNNAIAAHSARPKSHGPSHGAKSHGAKSQAKSQAKSRGSGQSHHSVTCSS